MKQNSTRFFALGLLGLSALLSGCSSGSDNGTGGIGGGGVGRNFTFGELTGASSVDPSGLLTRNAGATNTTALLGKFTSLDLSNPTRTREIGNIVFSIAPQNQGGQGGLQIGFIGADGAGDRNLTPSTDIDYYWPSISPRATKVAAVQAGKLVCFNIDGTGRTVLTAGASFSVYNAPSAWSPNDQNIAFVSYTGSINADPSAISRINRDGTALATLTTPGALQDHDPAWSPDGTKIAFVRNPPFGTAGTSSLMVISATGGTPTILLAGSEQRLASPSWSPNGSRIAFAIGKQISHIGANGSGLTALTSPPAEDTDSAPAWSARNQIAFVRSRFITGTGFSRLLKVVTPEGAEVQTANATDTRYSWSPGGDKIAFSVGGGIAVLNVRTGATNTLRANCFAPSWANPNRSNRHLLGASGEMSASGTGMMFGARPAGRANDTPASFVLFDSSSPASGFNLTLPAELNTGTNIAYQAEGKTASATLSSLSYWNFSSNEPVDVLGGSAADGAVVTFDSSTGEVSSVAPYQKTGRSATSPKAAKEGANLVLRGGFKAIFDKSGKNVAPHGATELRYDATGRLLSVK